jgi:DNA-binding NarL/FixJ family response regulator
MAAQEGGDDSPCIPVDFKQRDLNSDGGRRKHLGVNWRAVRLPVISVAVIDEHLLTRECIEISLQALGNNLQIESFAAFRDCLQSTNNHDIVLFHTHENMAHHGYDAEQLACLTRLLKTAPLIILSDFDCPESIFKAFESGATGFIPTATTSIKLAIEIIRLVQAGGTFVPRSTLFLRQPNREGATFPAVTIYGLTPRQMQVLDRLRLGKANKIIAYELGVSESTVKVEIHNIMKKMNATNRTEVACRAHAFAPSKGT